MKIFNKNKEKSNEYEILEDKDILNDKEETDYISEEIETSSKNKKYLDKKVAIIIAATLIVGGSGYAYYKTSQANKQNEELVSREREYFVEKGDIVAGVDGSGKLKLDRITQNFESSGAIDEIYVKEGQQINKGDKIASISTKKISEQLNTLYKQLKEINEQEKQSHNNNQSNDNNEPSNGNDKPSNGNNQPSNNNDKPSNENNNQGNENNQENVETENSDTENINSRGIQRENSDTENTETQNNNMRSNVTSNQDNNQSNAGIDSGSKDEIKKQISQLEKLKKSPVLYAEGSGIVYELGYEKGQETSPEKAVVTIAKEGDMYAEISVSQDDIVKLEKGQKTKIWVSTYEGDTFTGKISFINYKANTENGSTTYSVTVKLDGTDAKLLDGMSVSTQFIFKEINNAITLSNKAITLKDGKQIVKVRQEDGTLTEKEITTGFSDGKVSEILSGLKVGDIVVVGGQ